MARRGVKAGTRRKRRMGRAVAAVTRIMRAVSWVGEVGRRRKDADADGD